MSEVSRKKEQEENTAAKKRQKGQEENTASAEAAQKADERNTTAESTEKAGKEKVVAELVEEPESAPEIKVDISDVREDLSDIEVRNPRIGKVLKLQEEVERQNEIEKLRSKRIRQEQEYIDQMSLSVEEHLRETKEERKYNEAFEERIRYEVYQMHDMSEDKLFGMMQYRKAWYQGAAFALFFLSLALFVLCGVLHGFGTDICIFMAFYTAIEGALLSNGRKQNRFLELLTKGLYLLLFPTMMVVFVCFELGFEEYRYLVPIVTVAGVFVLVIGAISYFLYDPYQADRKKQKKANAYLREMERTALKEVHLKEKAYQKQERKKEKQEIKALRKQERTAARETKQAESAAKRNARRARIADWWEEKKSGKKTDMEDEK